MVLKAKANEFAITLAKAYNKAMQRPMEVSSGETMSWTKIIFPAYVLQSRGEMEVPYIVLADRDERGGVMVTRLQVGSLIH